MNAERYITCEEVIERLFDYLDRELDERQRNEMERHMSKCRDCFSRAEFERRLRRRVAAAGTQRAPERLRRRLKTLLDEF